MAFIHTPTGVYFDNRKQAVVIMGQKRYKQFLYNGEFNFDNTDLTTTTNK